MPVGLAFGLFASLAWGVVDVTGALASRRLGSLRVLAGTQAVSVAVLAGIVAVDPGRLGDDPVAGIVAGMPLGLAAAVAYLAYFTALRIGPLSVVSPVIVAYGGTTVVLAVVFRGETLLPAQALGALFATAGVVLAAIVFHDGTLRGARLVGPGVLVAVATMLLFATVTVALAAPIQAHGWLPVVVGSRIANATAGVVLLALARRSAAAWLGPVTHRAGAVDRATIGLVVAAGCFDIAAFTAYAVGLEVAPTWLVGLASSFGPVIVVAYAIVRLGERLRPTQWLGLALLAAGVVVLALSA